MKASYGKIGTPTMSTFESRLEFLNHPPEWHEEHRRQMKRQQQLEEFHQWATGPYVLGKWYRTVAEWAEYLLEEEAQEAEVEQAELWAKMYAINEEIINERYERLLEKYHSGGADSVDLMAFERHWSDDPDIWAESARW